MSMLLKSKKDQSYNENTGKSRKVIKSSKKRRSAGLKKPVQPAKPAGEPVKRRQRKKNVAPPAEGEARATRSSKRLDQVTSPKVANNDSSVSRSEATEDEDMEKKNPEKKLPPSKTTADIKKDDSKKETLTETS